MTVLYVLIGISLAVALTFLAAFVWAVRGGQFEDTTTPGLRLVGDDDRPATPPRRERA